MANINVSIEVDASDLQGKINMLRGAMTNEQFNRAMYGIFKRTGGHVKKILRSDLPQEYEIKPSAVSAAVQKPQVTIGGLGVGCAIPIRDARGSIGGRYKAAGGAHGWNSLHRKYRVKARIVKGRASTLPANASAYGGYPPFRNLGSSLGGLTFTRRGKARGPIEKMVGIAIPQMPMNRSQADVQRDIKEYMERQIDQRIGQLLRTGQ